MIDERVTWLRAELRYSEPETTALFAAFLQRGEGMEAELLLFAHGERGAYEVDRRELKTWIKDASSVLSEGRAERGKRLNEVEVSAEERRMRVARVDRYGAPMWRIFGGAVLVIAGIAAFIEANSNRPIPAFTTTERLQLANRTVITQFPASGPPQTAYDLIRIGAWELVIVGGLLVITRLIRYWRTRP
jgi:hypothetical protein